MAVNMDRANYKFDQFERILYSRIGQIEHAYFVTGEHPDYDESTDFCYDCLIDHVLTDEYAHHANYLSDNCVHCEYCSRVLQYNLYQSAIEPELEHYEEHLPVQFDNNELCYHLYALAKSIVKDEHKVRFVTLMSKALRNRNKVV